MSGGDGVLRTRRITVGHGLPIETQFGYSGALQLGGLVHVAGQLARDHKGQQVSGPLPTKLDAAYDNIAALLAKLGLSLAAIIQVQIHCTAPLPASLDAIARITADRLQLDHVAITILEVAGLNDPDGLVEISAVACAGERRSGEGRVATGKFQTFALDNSFAKRLGASDVVCFEDQIFVSGQMAVDDSGRLLHPGAIDAQFGVALDQVDAALRRAGSSISKVLALDIFTTVPLSPELFDSFCAAHRTRMTEYFPTGTMVRVVQLPIEGALVCVSAIAAR